MLSLAAVVVGIMAASAMLIKRDNDRGKAQIQRWAQGAARGAHSQSRSPFQRLFCSYIRVISQVLRLEVSCVYFNLFKARISKSRARASNPKP